MTALKPPGFNGGSPMSPPAFGAGSAPTAGVLDYEEPKKASALPLVAGLLFLGASVALLVLDTLGISPFTYDAVNVAGYALTPFLVFMALAWDSSAQRSGRRSPWFDIRPGYSRTLRVLAVVSLLVAIGHILEIGRAVGEWVVQAGLV